MKKLALITTLTFTMATSAFAFDIGGAVKGLATGAKDVNCASQALEIVKEAGEQALELFTQVSAGGEITLPSLKENQGLIANTTSYVQNGCAKSHLEKALATVEGMTTTTAQ